MPLRAPLPIVSGAHVEKAFTPGVTEKYEVRLHFRKQLTGLSSGTFMQQMQSADVAWAVPGVASGESTSYPKNWYGAGPDQGWIIGEFTAEKGKSYVLQSTVKSGPAELNTADPHIEVAVNTSRLTDYSYAEDFRIAFNRTGKMMVGVGALLLLLTLVLKKP